MVERPDLAGNTMVSGPGRPGWRTIGAVVAVAGLAIAALSLSRGSNAALVETLMMQQAETGRIALALASSQLHAAVLAGAPFTHELALVRTIGGANPDIAPQLVFLEPAQKTGISSLRRIVGEFEQSAARVLIEESTSPDANWFGQTLGRVSALSVAVLMEAQVNPFKSAVAPPIKEMQVALAEGDLHRALMHLDEMAEKPRETFAPWRALVQIRLDAIAAANKVAAQAGAMTSR